MKRFFFSLIALSAAVIGCTQSALLETPDFGGTEISFSPYTGRTPETKAESADLDYLKRAANQGGGFYVYSFLNQGQNSSDYLINEQVKWTSGAWKYTNTVYWPDAGSNSTLSFVAYSGNAVGKGIDNITKEGFTFNVPISIDNQVDLLATAYQDGYKLGKGIDNTGVVTLQFYHLLSRIGFKVKTSTTDKSVTIINLDFVGNMPATGTLKFKDAIKDSKNDQKPVWATKGSSSKQEYVYLTNATTPISGSQTAVRIPRNGSSDDYLMIMPHTVLDADHYIDVTYKIGENGSERNSKVYLPLGMEFKAGYAYELVLDISTSKLNFTVEEEPWGDEENTTEIDKPQPMPEPEPEPEPIVPEPMDPGYNPTSFTQDGVTITLDVIQIGLNFAQIHMVANGGMKNETMYDELIGIGYRKSGSSAWFQKGERYGQQTYDGTVDLTGLEADTEYEYTIYTLYKGKLSGSGTPSYAEGKIQTFRTLALITPPAATAPTLAMNEIVDADITSTTVQVSGSFKWGTVDGGDPEAIIEYGFCWMPGVGNPSTFNDKISFSNTTDKYGKDNLYTISPVTIGSSTTEPKSDALNFNTLYSCSLYVITENGDTYYTDPIVFTTKPSVSTDDNTGAPGWE